MTTNGLSAKEPSGYEYLAIAKRKWPQACVGGSGRWALYSPCGPMSKILLFETREECERSIIDPRYAVAVDLRPVPMAVLER